MNWRILVLSQGTYWRCQLHWASLLASEKRVAFNRLLNFARSDLVFSEFSRYREQITESLKAASEFAGD
jgi:hypothetical protein